MADDKSTAKTETKKEASSKPTGSEHYGEGGRFKIDASGKRVRVPVKQDVDPDAKKEG